MAAMYKVPSVLRFKDSKLFFQEFYQCNLPLISHRKFSDEIDWPISLLGDLIQGRKSLSVNRAVEFANFAKLTSVHCEHLIMMGLREAENPAAQTYAKDYLEKSAFQVTDPTNNYVLETPPTNEHHPERGILRNYLVWTQGQMDFEMLAKVLPSFKKFQDPEFVKQLLQEMADLGIIDGTTAPIKVLKKNILNRQPDRDFFEKGYKVFLDLIETDPRNAVAFQGAGLFPRNKLHELLHKQNALQKWIMATTAVSELPPDHKPEDYTILLTSLSFGELLEHNLETPEKIRRLMSPPPEKE